MNIATRNKILVAWVGGIALASGFYLRRAAIFGSVPASLKLTLTLTHVAFTEDSSILQFQPFDVDWILHNGSADTITVEGSDQSEGWEAFLADGSVEVLKFPVTVSSQSKFRFRGRVDTVAGAGRIRPVVRLSRKGKSSSFHIESDVRLRVRPAWRACPDSLIVSDVPSGEIVRKNIDLYDAFPGRGIDIARVEASGPDRLQVAFKEIMPSEALDLYTAHPGQWEIPEQDRMLRYHQRHRLEITCTVPPKGMEMSEEVRVFAAAECPSKVPPLVISIVVRPAKMAYELSPDRLDLVVGSSHSPDIRRKILFRSNAGPIRDLVVKAVPDFVKVIVRPVDSLSKIVEVVVRDLSGDKLHQEGEVVLGLGDSSKIAVRLPVSLVRVSD